MKFENLAHLFVTWGYLIKPQEYEGFKTYLDSMLKRQRVMVIQEEGHIVAVVTFFITNDYCKSYKKSEWEIAEEDENGSQIYIDKMICKRWTTDIRRAVQDLIETRFPNVMEGFYLRAPYDRVIKIYRKGVKSCLSTQ